MNSERCERGDTVAQGLLVIGFKDLNAGGGRVAYSEDDRLDSSGKRSQIRCGSSILNSSLLTSGSTTDQAILSYDSFWSVDQPYAVDILGKFVSKVGKPLEIPVGVESFCFPLGGAYVHKGLEAPLPSCHTFVLTGRDGNRLHGISLVMWENPLDDPVIREQELCRLTTLHLILQVLPSKGADLTEDEMNQAKTEARELAESFFVAQRSVRKVWTPRVVCLLSRYPFYSSFYAALHQIFSISVSFPEMGELENIFGTFLCETPVPPRGSFEVLLELPPISIKFSRPPPNDLPLLDVPVSLIFNYLSIEDVCTVFISILLERPVGIFSSNLSLLTPICEALRSFTYPTIASTLFFPLLPIPLIGLLGSPVPFLSGIPNFQDSISKALTHCPSMLAVNIDTGQLITSSQSASITLDLSSGATSVPTPNLPSCPNRPLKKLFSRIALALNESNHAAVAETAPANPSGVHPGPYIGNASASVRTAATSVQPVPRLPMPTFNRLVPPTRDATNLVIRDSSLMMSPTGIFGVSTTTNRSDPTATSLPSRTSDHAVRIMQHAAATLSETKESNGGGGVRSSQIKVSPAEPVIARTTPIGCLSEFATPMPSPFASPQRQMVSCLSSQSSSQILTEVPSAAVNCLPSPSSSAKGEHEPSLRTEETSNQQFNRSQDTYTSDENFDILQRRGPNSYSAFHTTAVSPDCALNPHNALYKLAFCRIDENNEEKIKEKFLILEKEKQIRAAFFQFIIAILMKVDKNYRDDGSFNISTFVSDHSDSDRPFYEALVSSTSFLRLISNRMLPESEETALSILLFRESQAAKRNRSRFKLTKTLTPFLSLDTWVLNPKRNIKIKVNNNSNIMPLKKYQSTSNDQHPDLFVSRKRQARLIAGVPVPCEPLFRLQFSLLDQRINNPLPNIGGSVSPLSVSSPLRTAFAANQLDLALRAMGDMQSRLVSMGGSMYLDDTLLIKSLLEPTLCCEQVVNEVSYSLSRKLAISMLDDIKLWENEAILWKRELKIREEILAELKEISAIKGDSSGGSQRSGRSSSQDMTFTANRLLNEVRASRLEVQSRILANAQRRRMISDSIGRSQWFITPSGGQRSSSGVVFIIWVFVFSLCLHETRSDAETGLRIDVALSVLTNQLKNAALFPLSAAFEWLLNATASTARPDLAMKVLEFMRTFAIAPDERTFVLMVEKFACLAAWASNMVNCSPPAFSANSCSDSAFASGGASDLRTFENITPAPMISGLSVRPVFECSNSIFSKDFGFVNSEWSHNTGAHEFILRNNKECSESNNQAGKNTLNSTMNGRFSDSTAGSSGAEESTVKNNVIFDGNRKKINTDVPGAKISTQPQQSNYKSIGTNENSNHVMRPIAGTHSSATTFDLLRRDVLLKSSELCRLLMCNRTRTMDLSITRKDFASHTTLFTQNGLGHPVVVEDNFGKSTLGCSGARRGLKLLSSSCSSVLLTKENEDEKLTLPLNRVNLSVLCVCPRCKSIHSVEDIREAWEQQQRDISSKLQAIVNTWKQNYEIRKQILKQMLSVASNSHCVDLPSPPPLLASNFASGTELFTEGLSCQRCCATIYAHLVVSDSLNASWRDSLGVKTQTKGSVVIPLMSPYSLSLRIREITTEQNRNDSNDFHGEKNKNCGTSNLINEPDLNTSASSSTSTSTSPLDGVLNPAAIKLNSLNLLKESPEVYFNLLYHFSSCGLFWPFLIPSNNSWDSFMESHQAAENSKAVGAAHSALEKMSCASLKLLRSEGTNQPQMCSKRDFLADSKTGSKFVGESSSKPANLGENSGAKLKGEFYNLSAENACSVRDFDLELDAFEQDFNYSLGDSIAAFDSSRVPHKPMVVSSCGSKRTEENEEEIGNDIPNNNTHKNFEKYSSLSSSNFDNMTSLPVLNESRIQNDNPKASLGFTNLRLELTNLEEKDECKEQQNSELSFSEQLGGHSNVLTCIEISSGICEQVCEQVCEQACLEIGIGSHEDIDCVSVDSNLTTDDLIPEKTGMPRVISLIEALGGSSRRQSSQSRSQNRSRDVVYNSKNSATEVESMAAAAQEAINRHTMRNM